MLSFIYLPVVVAPFARHDDYLLAEAKPEAHCRDNNAYASMLTSGRPLLAELHTCVFQPLYQRFPQTEFFIFLRFLTLLVLGVSAGILSHWMFQVLKRSFWESQCITLLLFTLPGFHFFIGQALAAENTPAILIALVPLLILRDGQLTGQLKQVLVNWPGVFLAVLMLVFSMFIYQSDVLIFLWPGFLAILLGEKIDWRVRRILVCRHLCIWMSALVAYLFIKEYLLIPGYLHFFPQRAEIMSRAFLDMKVCTDIKIMAANLWASFYQVKAWNLWLISESDQVALTIMALLGIVVAAFLVRELIAWRANRLNPARRWFLIQSVALLVMIYLGVQTVQFMRDAISTYYRVLVFYSGLIVIALVWAVRWGVGILWRSAARQFVTMVLLLWAFVTSVMAQTQSYRDFAQISMTEMDFLAASIEPLLQEQVSQVFLVRPFKNIYVLGDEHSMFTLKARTDYGIEGMFHRVYRNRNLDFSDLEFIYSIHPGIVLVVNRRLLSLGNENSISINGNFLLLRHSKSF